MNAKFQIDGLLKFAEEDNYNEGCDPSTTTHFHVDMKFTGDTAQDVVNKVAEYLSVDGDGIEYNACDEPGRVDFSLMEDENGTSPSKAQMTAWKRGKCKLWAVTYTGYVEKVEPVTL